MGISATQPKSTTIKFQGEKTSKGNTADKNRALLNNSGGNAGKQTKNWLPENESEFAENGRWGAKFGRSTGPFSESRWVNLKVDGEQRRTAWGKTEINRPVSNVAIQIALRLNVIFG